MTAPASGTGTPGQAAYEARMEAVWGTDWELAEPAYSELSEPDQVSWVRTAEYIADRVITAAAAAQPAPGDLAVVASRLGYALAALDMIVLYHGDGALGIAEKALGDDKAIREGAVVLHEQPAPELAAVREQRNALTDAVRNLASELEHSAAATMPSKKSAIEIETARKLRELLNERTENIQHDGQYL